MNERRPQRLEKPAVKRDLAADHREAGLLAGAAAQVADRSLQRIEHRPQRQGRDRLEPLLEGAHHVLGFLSVVAQRADHRSHRGPQLGVAGAGCAGSRPRPGASRSAAIRFTVVSRSRRRSSSRSRSSRKRSTSRISESTSPVLTRQLPSKSVGAVALAKTVSGSWVRSGTGGGGRPTGGPDCAPLNLEELRLSLAGLARGRAALPAGPRSGSRAGVAARRLARSRRPWC